MDTRKSTLSVFQNKTFRNLWLGNQASNFGSIMQTVGAAWLMTSLTSSPGMVALVQASTALPVMVLSAISGVFADSYDRRRVMLVAQVFMCIVALTLTALTLMGLVTPWMLLACTFLIGCGTALKNPSWHASVGDVVSREDLPSAVSLNSMGMNLMRSVGPAAGGAIVAVAGAAAAFAVNAASYFGIIAALLGWTPPERKRLLPREALPSALSAGVRYVAMSPNIMTVILRGFLFGAAGIAVQSLLPLVARDTLDGTALTYGLLLGAFGGGAVAGAVYNGRMRARFGGEIITRIAFAGFATCPPVLAFSPWLVPDILALAIAGACWVMGLSLFNTTVQLSTPRWVLGRALALYQTGLFGGMALGSWVWGMVAEAWDLHAALLGGTVVLMLGALVGLRMPMPSTDDLRVDLLNPDAEEPEVTLPLAPQSGPIVVTIRYRIAEDDLPRFLDLMRQRRRVRLRDGARRWQLLRDLVEPQSWIESYQAANWTEYRRHHQRRTQMDEGVFEEIRALHMGDKPIEVRRMIEREPVWRTDAPSQNVDTAP